MRKRKRTLVELLAQRRAAPADFEPPKLRIRFAAAFPDPTPEESERIRQSLRESGSYELWDSEMRNFAREVGGDDDLLAKVRERLQRGERAIDIDLEDL
jgi:hypothetical protein